jgi:hypothetical protein
VAAARIRLLISRLASISRNFFPPARSPAPEAARPRMNSKDGKEEWGRVYIPAEADWRALGLGLFLTGLLRGTGFKVSNDFLANLQQ